TTTTTSPTTTAMQESVQTIGSVGQSVVGNALNVAPTIFVDQGQRIRIFANKDLIFPTSLTGSTRFVE
ncbi:MAG: TrbI/VirB10 family protein, partial [Pseudomonadota bacterium]